MSLCKEIMIKILDVKNKGFQSLNSISWKLISSNPSNQDSENKINMILEESSAQSLEFIKIPPMVVSEFTIYEILITVENFAGVRGSKTFTFQTSSTQSIEIEFEGNIQN